MFNISFSSFRKKWRGQFSSAKFKLKFFYISGFKKIKSNRLVLFFRRFVGASKILSIWEKRLLILLLLVFVLGTIFFIRERYLSRTKEVPDYGGVYVEGVVGKPSQINPIFATSDIDKALSRLLFRGLTKIGDDKKIVSDLAKFTISQDGLSYVFTIKKDAFWHDGEEVIADDVLFTIALIKDEAYKGPYQGVWNNATVSKIDDKKVSVTLGSVHAPFLEEAIMGILPSHILGGLSVEDIRESEFNMNPIGCGPYKIIRSMAPREKKISTLSLRRFDRFYEDIKIEKITFNFYDQWQEVVSAFEKGEIMGLANLTFEKENYFTTTKDLVRHRFQIPQYMALFFNIKKSQIKDQDIRLAITKGINKENIFKIYSGAGKIIESPILPGMLGYRNLPRHQYSQKEAEKIFKKLGYKKNDKGIYQKDTSQLSFDLATIDNDNLKIAKEIKGQLKKIGVEIKIQSLPLANLQAEYIIPRKYDLLLIGINSGFDTDPYPFWHSSQGDEEGLNLSLISDNQIDELLTEARQTINGSERKEKYQQFAQALHQLIPAVFLYQPDYVFATNRAVRGIKENWLMMDSDRFFFINNWYIKTKRISK